MADYCQQCSADIWGEPDSSDLSGLFEQPDAAEQFCVGALCEGCGFTFVDADGKCVGPHDFAHQTLDAIPLRQRQ